MVKLKTLNNTELTYLLNKPEAINEKQTMALEVILHQYPFLQSVRVLHLKGLYNQDSFRYNYELKKTAAYTTDRTVLFDFITSKNFITLQKNIIEEQEKAINNIIVHEISTVETANVNNKIYTSEEKNEDKLKEKLEIGKPPEFNENKKYSFQEWLQLAKFAPIERNEEVIFEKIDEEKSKKIDLINKFIEANPKIPAIKETTETAVNTSKNNEEPSLLMTETLANVYLEQRKYQRAIQAYEILILKYPEKSSFFANRIKSIRELQQNNN